MFYLNSQPIFFSVVKKVEQVQFSPFTELLTEGFDNDQIWEEIASQNEPFLDYAKTALKALNKRPAKEFSDEEGSVSGQSMDLDQNLDEDEDMEELDQSEQELDKSEQELDQSEEEDIEEDLEEDVEEDAEEQLVEPKET